MNLQDKWVWIIETEAGNLCWGDEETVIIFPDEETTKSVAARLVGAEAKYCILFAVKRVDFKEIEDEVNAILAELEEGIEETN